MINRNGGDPGQDAAHRLAERAVHWAIRNPRSPITRLEIVRDALWNVEFRDLFEAGDGPIGEAEFNEWHTEAVNILRAFERRLNVGWAAKMIAIYLKTTCYEADLGREGLAIVIHPPLSHALMRGLRRRFRGCADIIAGLNHFQTISGMDFDVYHAVIESCRMAAGFADCSLFEVEQFCR